MALQWQHCSDGEIPRDAVCGGWEAGNGEPLYVGRAHHSGSLIVGKVHPSHHCCYVPFGGTEHKKEDYEVLVNPGNHAHLEWMYGSNGCIPDKPVEGGRDSCGEVYYIGRHSHHGDTIPGKIQASHKCLYISYAGKEISKKEYGVLVKE